MSPAARYDAVVLGGGHHSTIIAPYLARAGMSVAVFERGGRFGGAAMSGKGPLTGFRMNLYSHWTRFYSHPAYRDFNLYDEGLRYAFPEGNEAMVFDDRTAFVGYSAARVVDDRGTQEPWPEGVKRTEEAIRRFSDADADTYLRIHDAYTNGLKQAFGAHRFTAPPPWGVKDPLEAHLSPDGLIQPVHQFMSLRQLAYDFFESDELRTLFMRAATTSTGCYGDDVPGLQGLVHVLGLTLSLEPAAIAIGGTQAITDALVSAGRRRGVEYFGKAPVTGILTRNGRASGIRLASGDVVEADLVVSGLGLPQTLLTLASGVSLPRRTANRLRNVHYDRGQLAWINVAVHEAPDYASAVGDPGVGAQPRLYWGPKDPDWLGSRYQAEIFTRGHSSRFFALSSTDTLWDPSRAPEGKHVVGVEEFVAPLRFFDRQQWKAIEKSVVDLLVESWPTYAPNMTRDNIAGVHILLPRDIQATHPDMIEGGYSQGTTMASQSGRFRPVPELSGYRTVLPNLYNCSSSMHSGSGIGRGSSLNCWRAIATDLGIDPDATVAPPAARS
ncbi:NAD(P)/FAD-dependent oxidoreductase [Virgisporangium ochraceum]|uniref:Pyridine nucleotide-disulfide oxidoreductase domain-containing protein 2 n=1 Tax=Virgisporangium ochraceum TaxID=65505 RepID=A0A8J4A1I3_9ACTN|nr:NAD(P)/FAD-dependent oxidoreductase [Virgisporangium ochraceum]GIJ72877.1 FAD-dependent oxidoreductase [Virgisporangium ochraceum]